MSATPEESPAKRRKNPGEADGEKDPSHSHSHLHPHLTKITAYAVSNQGKKHYQEDRYVMHGELSHLHPTLTETRYSFYGVFDGHAGEFCSEYLREHLPAAVAEELSATFTPPSSSSSSEQPVNGSLPPPSAAAAVGGVGAGVGGVGGEQPPSSSSTSTSTSTSTEISTSSSTSTSTSSSSSSTTTSSSATTSTTSTSTLLWAGSGPIQMLDAERVKLVQKALVEAFTKTDKKLCHDATAKKQEDGSCAVTCCVIGDQCFIGNVGDSKAALGRAKRVNGKITTMCVPLSKDHTPLLVEERKRIESKGGFVDQNGRVCGRLAVSRSFGDVVVKKKGVTAQPEFTKFTISPSDRFIILACDGLWSVFPVREAVEFVDRELTTQWIKQKDAPAEVVRMGAKLTTDPPALVVCRKVAEKLIREAVLTRGCRDNCTALLLIFGDGEERIEAAGPATPAGKPTISTPNSKTK